MYHPDAVCTIKNAPHAENAGIFTEWILGDRTQVYLQKSQYQTNLFSIRDVMELGRSDSKLKIVNGNPITAAERRSEWLQRFYELMEQ